MVAINRWRSMGLFRRKTNGVWLLKPQVAGWSLARPWCIFHLMTGLLVEWENQVWVHITVEIFSHDKVVFTKHLLPDTLRLLYPPYVGFKENLIKKLLA